MVPRRPSAEGCRPRVEGAREEEVLDAAVALLLEVGYDRLTMDAVAQRARASKATLYRRWSSKQQLVVDAVVRSKKVRATEPPDTGTLRGDLLGLVVDQHGLVQEHNARLMGAVITPLAHDREFSAAFRERVLAPKVAQAVEVYRRAAERGELVAGADPRLLGPALPGILLHRAFVLGEPLTRELVERVVDQIILPAATGRPPSTTRAPQPPRTSQDLQEQP